MGKANTKRPSKVTHKNNKTLAVMALILAGFIWGVNYPVVKIGLEHYSPMWFWVLKYLLAMFIFALIFWRKAKSIPLNHHPKLALISWVGLSGSAMLMYYGLKYARGMDVAVVAALGPIVLYWLAIYVLKERFHERALVGTILAFAGVLVISLQPFMNSETLQAASILGIGLFFLGVVLDNLGTVCVKPFVKKYDWHSVMLWRFIYAIAPVLALALIVEPVPPISLEPEAVFAVLYGVLAVVLVAFSLFYFGIKHLKGVQLSALFYIDPVVGVFASSAILGEQPGTYFWVGAALVTAGVTAAEVHVKKHHRSHSFKHLHYHLKLHI